MNNLFIGIALYVACAGIVIIIAYFIMRQYSVPRPLIPPDRKVLDQTDLHQTVVKTAQCPWCGSAEFNDSDPSYTCSVCGTLHHSKCCDLHGGCSTPECINSPIYKPVANKLNT